MAEGWGVDVEGDAQGVRFLLAFQPQQRGEKAEHGVGVQPVPGGKRADAVVGPVDNGIAVNDHEFHGLFLLAG